MTPETLNKLNDDELRAVITSSQALLKDRDQERKENATAQAKALLESVGLSFKEVAGKPSRRPVSYKAGSPYRHPSKPELTWNGKGQKPNWLRELEKQGLKAVEITEPATAAARKAG
jgi:DNA-binding protein H-NS